ncbi:RagB/SusD family nutrient uptake outer membrane protein [Compostibacter hankyongensis]|uniref:RagB/SusD family nutrient uptake outer membrane protein n=1 Tax=Compostibacter hankyongensis TaxID=1007089 RepID=A0ABP8FRM5_9BACT
MRKIIICIIGFPLVFLFSSCEKDFLDRKPLDQISQVEFWKTTSDMETYLNTLYASLPGWGTHDAGPFWIDNNSDNMVPGLYNTHLAGLTVLPVSGGGWDWTNVRAANVFLSSSSSVEDGAEGDKQHFLGEGYFFRAWFYFELFQQFGGLPWIDEPLETNSPELYGMRQPRNITADHILSDLDSAIILLKDAGQAPVNRVNRSVALAFKSRVALYEGTWEKYHAGTVFGITDGDPGKYLKQSLDASEQLMESGKFAIYNTGHPESDYDLLFNQSDLSGNPEIIFWRKYKEGLLTHNGQRYLSIIAGNTGISKSLVDSYLCTDGRPISSSRLYRGDSGLLQVVKNRDLRLRQLIFVPGDPITIDFSGGGDTLSVFGKAKINLGGDSRDVTGYQIKKGAYPDKTLQQADFTSTTAAILFRYAEVLLNFAEAKAELGTITQSDIDRSINLLRKRAGVAALQLADIASDPGWDFPELSPVINEIRRERRVELACEGYRYNDLCRWSAHRLIVHKRAKGARFIARDYPDNININVDEDGYIDPYQKSLPNGYGFNIERDYLYPLPAYDLSLNEKLEQNPGWPRK